VPLFRGKEPRLITAIVTCLQLEYYAPVSMALFGWNCESFRHTCPIHAMPGSLHV
jgi:hypothetical protein